MSIRTVSNIRRGLPFEKFQLNEYGVLVRLNRVLIVLLQFETSRNWIGLKSLLRKQSGCAFFGVAPVAVQPSSLVSMVESIDGAAEVSVSLSRIAGLADGTEFCWTWALVVPRNPELKSLRNGRMLEIVAARME